MGPGRSLFVSVLVYTEHYHLPVLDVKVVCPLAKRHGRRNLGCMVDRDGRQLRLRPNHVI